jgi:branched-chain amino acid transport system substrate-binding protein
MLSKEFVQHVLTEIRRTQYASVGERSLHEEGVRQANNGMRANFFGVSGYDGMHLIYEAIRKTGGKTDGDSFIGAVKGMSWESPRGPMTIDPETRDVISNIYLRRVERVNGELWNIEFATVENFKDPVKAAKK